MPPVTPRITRATCTLCPQQEFRDSRQSSSRAAPYQRLVPQRKEPHVAQGTRRARRPPNSHSRGRRRRARPDDEGAHAERGGGPGLLDQADHERQEGQVAQSRHLQVRGHLQVLVPQLQGGTGKGWPLREAHHQDIVHGLKDRPDHAEAGELELLLLRPRGADARRLHGEEDVGKRGAALPAASLYFGYVYLILPSATSSRDMVK